MQSGLSFSFYQFVQQLEEENRVYLPTSQAEDLSSLVSMAMQQEISVTQQNLREKEKLLGFSESQSIEIKLQPMRYEEIRSISNALSGLPEIKHPNLIQRTFNYSLVQETWFLASYIRNYKRSSLTSIISALKGFYTDSRVPVESILAVIVKATELANQIFLQTKTIGPFYLENIYLSQENKILELNFEVFTIEFLQKKQKWTGIYPERLGFSFKAFFWSMGIMAYSCLTGLELSELPNFACMSYAEIEILLDKLEFIPELTPLIKRFFEGSIIDFDSVIKSNSFMTWSFLLSCTTKNPEKLCPHAFYSLFYFNTKNTVYQNLPFLCTSNEFVDELGNEIYRKNYIYNKITQHLTDFPELNEGMLEFSLQFLIKLKQISPLSIKKNCLQLIHRIIKLKINYDDSSLRKLLIKTLVFLLNDNTLTVQLIFQNAGILYYLYENFPSDSGQLFQYISCLGAKSLEHIRFFRSSQKYSDPNDSILYMHQIPIHFKLQMTFDILQELEDLMKIWKPAMIIDNKRMGYMCLVVTIINELLIAAKEAKLCNQIGKCFKNSLNYRVAPVMVNCTTCNKNICLSCAQYHIESTHKTTFLTHYKITSFTCQEESPALTSLHPSRNVLPSCEEIYFESVQHDGISYTWKVREVQLPKSVVSGIVYYCEIFFAKCESEDIVVSLGGSKIEYDNNIPGIVKNSAFYCNAPKIGAIDTLGIGLTGDFKVFFTYNGFNLGQYIECSCKSIVIEVKINSFIQPILSGNSPSLYNMQAYSFFEKEKLDNYKYISNIFVGLVLLKKKLMKKCVNSSMNLYAVVDELKTILDFNSLKDKLKRENGHQSIGQGCKPF